VQSSPGFKTILNFITFALGQLRLLLKPECRVKIVTASDHTHAMSLINLLDSLLNYSWFESIVVYDLGLPPNFVQTLTTRYPNVQLKNFDFSKYPPHFSMHHNSGSYAWKPVIIKDEIDTAEGVAVLWLDAGCIVTLASWLLPKRIARESFFANPASNSLESLTHKTTLENFFQVFPDSRQPFLQSSNQKMVSASFIGLVDSPSNRSLVSSWAKLAMKPEFIGPPGATKFNHRFDQALLSLLLMGEFRDSPRYDYIKHWAPSKLLGISIQQDAEKST
jgi:hypothetical protein